MIMSLQNKELAFTLVFWVQKNRAYCNNTTKNYLLDIRYLQKKNQEKTKRERAKANIAKKSILS